MELGYKHVYFHRDILSDRPNETDRPGFFSSRPVKILLLGQYRRALNRADYINPSEESIGEALSYIYYPNGGVGPDHLVQDSTGALEAHGDRVIADALGYWAIKEQPNAQRRFLSGSGSTPASRRRVFLRKKAARDPWKP
jgi:hypothetical protein